MLGFGGTRPSPPNGNKPNPAQQVAAAAAAAAVASSASASASAAALPCSEQVPYQPSLRPFFRRTARPSGSSAAPGYVPPFLLQPRRRERLLAVERPGRDVLSIEKISDVMD
ncbi:hypothetical protein SEVIR_5G022150v4 [Setaria viridis]